MKVLALSFGRWGAIKAFKLRNDISGRLINMMSGLEVRETLSIIRLFPYIF